MRRFRFVQRWFRCMPHFPRLTLRIRPKSRIQIYAFRLRLTLVRHVGVGWTDLDSPACALSDVFKRGRGRVQGVS